jgi:hypothetical protein
MCNVDDDEKFSLSVEYDGFFYGLHPNILYICGSAHYFDNCSTDTFSILFYGLRISFRARDHTKNLCVLERTW